MSADDICNIIIVAGLMLFLLMCAAAGVVEAWRNW